MSHGESVGSSRGKSGGEIVGDVVSQDEAVAWMLELGWSRAAAVEVYICIYNNNCVCMGSVCGCGCTTVHANTHAH